MTIKRDLEGYLRTVLPENVPTITYILGAMSPWQGKFCSSSIYNQPQSARYKPDEQQGFQFLIADPRGDSSELDGWWFTVFVDETVKVEYTYTVIIEAEGTREHFSDNYTGDFRTLLNWLRSGCDTDYIHYYFTSDPSQVFD